MATPKVSVIIPAYNAEAILEKCLQSLKRQTYKNFEVIVVDDCSSDHTLEIARREFSALKTPENSGAGTARNLGAEKAEGEILAFTDADVVLPAGWVEKIVNSITEHKVACVGGGYCGSVGETFIEKFQHYELVNRRKNIPEFVQTIVSNNFACLKTVFREAGGFPADYRGGSLEDMAFSYKISRKHRIYWNKDNGVYHHFRPDLRGYLKQQYVFGRDTLLTYYRYPELFLIKTFQGRSLYFEIMVTLLTMAFSFYSVFYLWLGITAILLINLTLLNFLRKAGLPILKGFSVILLRDIVVAASLPVGLALSAKGLITSFRSIPN